MQARKVKDCVFLRGDKSIMRLLLDKVGVDPNSQQGREQNAAMHAAAKSGTALSFIAHSYLLHWVCAVSCM